MRDTGRGRGRWHVQGRLAREICVYAVCACTRLASNTTALPAGTFTSMGMRRLPWRSRLSGPLTIASSGNVERRVVRPDLCVQMRAGHHAQAARGGVRVAQVGDTRQH